MEELAHIRLKHKSSQLVSFDRFAFSRSYNKTQETEAFWVGAAALVPGRVLKGARTLGWTLIKVASEHGVSLQLVRFRQNVVGIRLLES
jgi:Zn-dependent peptidase ImmA (M78 family)